MNIVTKVTQKVTSSANSFANFLISKGEFINTKGDAIHRSVLNFSNTSLIHAWREVKFLGGSLKKKNRKNVTYRQLATLGLCTLQVYGFWVVGEMIGRADVSGYDFDGIENLYSEEEKRRYGNRKYWTLKMPQYDNNIFHDALTLDSVDIDETLLPQPMWGNLDPRGKGNYAHDTESVKHLAKI